MESDFVQSFIGFRFRLEGRATLRTAIVLTVDPVKLRAVFQLCVAGRAGDELIGADLGEVDLAAAGHLVILALLAVAHPMRCAVPILPVFLDAIVPEGCMHPSAALVLKRRL